MMGHVDDRTFSLSYSAADVFGLPSHIEGFPATLLESRAYGLPVIVGPFPGVERIVTHQENGIVLDVVTPDSIAAAIRVMLSSSDRLKRMAQANASAFSSANSWRVVAGILCELYERSHRNFKI